MLRLVGSVLAVISLIRLWGFSQYKIMWWIILVLFIFDWLTGETVKNAARGGSEKDVIKYWVWINMIISFLCIVLSLIGIILSFV
ncbi:MAG: hypothetical protein ACFFDN_21920 [Candidatus Hodarchaeota archaeon]